MIVFRGYGFLVLFFFLIPPGLLSWYDKLWPQHMDMRQGAMLAAIGWGLAGVICWMLGRSLNRQSHVTGRCHDLYFLRMEYWAFLLWSLTAVVLVGFPMGWHDVPNPH